MFTIKIKPLSLNSAYRGRRFATPELDVYKYSIYRKLPKMAIKTGKFSVKYIFGVSSKNADGDNLIKVFQDCLAKKYSFNDKNIYRWEVEKVDVKKGDEYISFEIRSFE